MIVSSIEQYRMKHCMLNLTPNRGLDPDRQSGEAILGREDRRKGRNQYETYDFRISSLDLDSLS